MKSLKPCSVPWQVSPSGGLAITFIEEDEFSCSVRFSASRWQLQSGGIIELKFLNPGNLNIRLIGDDQPIEAAGFKVQGRDSGYVTGDAAEYLANLRSVWRDTGVCPAPSFYVASPTGNKFVNSRHYLIHSRNVFVELEAEGYSWREWEWKLPERDDNISEFDPVASGEGFE